MHYFMAQEYRGRKEKTHAFTLIELLVVIAIIALLAAILFPAFARAKECAACFLPEQLEANRVGFDAVLAGL